MHTSHLTIEDLQTYFTTNLKNVRSMIRKQALDVLMIANSLIQPLKGFTIHINTRLMFVNSLERRERLVKKVNYVHLFTMNLN